MSLNKVTQGLDGKWYNVSILAVSALLAMGLRYSASAVLGPIFGTISMLKLGTLPEAEQMASGNR